MWDILPCVLEMLYREQTAFSVPKTERYRINILYFSDTAIM